MYCIVRLFCIILEMSFMFFVCNFIVEYWWKLFEFKMVDEERRKGEKKGIKFKGKLKFCWKKLTNLFNIGNKEKGRCCYIRFGDLKELVIFNLF